MRKDTEEYFRALNLSPGAGPTEIRRAYRQMVRQWHPDLFKPGSPMQTTAEDITKEINEAYDQLYRKKLYRKHLSKADRTADRAAEREDADPPPKPAPQAPRRAAEPERPRRAPWRQRLGGLWRWPLRHPSLRWVLGGLAGAGLLAAAFTGIRGWLDRVSGAPASAPAAEVAGARPPRPGEPPKPTPSAVPQELAAAAPTPAGRPESPRFTSIADSPSQAHRPDRAFRDSPFAEERAPLQTAANASQGGFVPQASPLAAARSQPAPEADPRSDLIGRAETLLDAFGIGDTKARVVMVQGRPDEAGQSVYRYGSSLVYFERGYVSGWSDRLPHLKTRNWPAVDPVRLDRFRTGSTRADVVAAQGLPSRYSLLTYSYGSSVVFFDGGLVSTWMEGDEPLQGLEIPVLPFGPDSRGARSGTPHLTVR
jgi:hypothetical protein